MNRSEDRFEVRSYRDISESDWNVFVGSCSTGNLGLSYEFAAEDVEIGSKPISFAVIDRLDGRILFAAVTFKTWSGKLVMRNGAAVANTLPRHYFGHFAQFVKRYIRLLLKEQKSDALYVEWPAFCSVNWDNPCINPLVFMGCEPAIRYTWMVDLNVSDEVLLKRCEITTRQAIRKLSQDDSICVKCFDGDVPIDVIEEYWKISEDTYNRNQASPRNFGYYRALVNGLDNARRKVYVLQEKGSGKIIVGAIVILCVNSAQYAFGASDKSKPIGASKYLIFEAMKDLKKKGIEHFEVGGAYPHLDKSDKRRGISDFKKSFGGCLFPIVSGVFTGC